MLICQQCGHQNPDSFDYCLRCAAALKTTAAHDTTSGLRAFIPPTLTEKIQAATSGIVGQRRDVTVLVLTIDLAMSTSIEDTYLLEQNLTPLLAEIVYEYEGHIDQISGQKMVALFGAPIMHENDAERAVRVALSLQSRLPAQISRASGAAQSSSEFRIGLNTGAVMMGTIGSAVHVNYTVIGNTINLATQLAQSAASNTILVSDSTYTLTYPLFHFRELAAAVENDRQETKPAYEPLSIRQKPGQLRGLPGMHSPMIGRETALIRLQTTGKQVVSQRHEQLVNITGRAGVGKSRLLLEFRRLLENSDPTGEIAIFSGHSQSHTHSRPYWIVADLLRKIVGLSEADKPIAQLRHLTDFLAGGNLSHTRPFLAYLLGLSQIDSTIESHLQFFDAGMLQKSTHAALRQVILTIADQSPTILIFEDLHWADSASWTFLQYLVQLNERIPLMLIFTSRESVLERLPQPGMITTEIRLRTLSQAEGNRLINQLIKHDSEEAQLVKAKIAERAAGNPFYMEEMIRMLLDQGGILSGNGSWHVTDQAQALLADVPGTVQALILARFDSLNEPLQQLLQKAAVLGPSFSFNLIQSMVGSPAPTMTSRLTELVERQFLSIPSAENDTRYRFRHTLIQETIYKTLLRRHRQQWHKEAADLLEQHPEWLPSERVELLIYHYSHSKNPAPAIPYLLQAADDAARRYAHETAVYYYQQILQLTEKYTKETTETTLLAQIGLGQTFKFQGQYEKANEILAQALQSLLQWSMEAKPIALLSIMASGLREMADIQARKSNFETAIAYLEAGIDSLGAAGAETYPYFYRSIMERIVFIRFRQGKLDEAFDLAQILLIDTSHDKTETPVILANLYNTLGGISWQQGNLDSAIHYVKQGLAIYETLNYTWGMANALNNLGILYAQQGNWQQTIHYWEKTLTLRREIGDIQNQAINLLNLGQLRVSVGEHELARADLHNALAIANRLDDAFIKARVHASLARIALMNQRIDSANQHIQTSKSLADHIGGTDIQVEARWINGMVQAQQNQFEVGLKTVANALQMAKDAGLVEAEADCLRVYGILHTKTNQYQIAETYFRESIELSLQINDPYRQGLASVEIGRLYTALMHASLRSAAEWHSRAQNTLNEAITIFSRLGAKYDLKQAKSVLKELNESIPHQKTEAENNGDAGIVTGERRTAVILQLRLSIPDSTDEETLFDMMTFVMPACATIAQEYSDHVRQLPDGFTILYGVPTAHENDTENAVHTAQHILHYLQRAEIQEEFSVSAQMVITQGPVIAGDAVQGQRPDLLVVGEPVEQAQMLITAVSPNTIWVTDPVRLASERLFTYELIERDDLGSLPLWQFIKKRDTPAPARGLTGIQTRFIGREASLQAMLDLSANLDQTIGGIVIIEGEAGIGKSRLIREFKTAVNRSDTLIWNGGCSSKRVNHAFSLFADLFHQLFNLQPIDTPDQIQRKIATGIENWHRDAQAAQPYLQMLAGVQPTGTAGERLKRLEPEQLRQQTFVAIRRLLIAQARQQPLILLLDDLHWIDPVSAELLVFVATMVTTDPILFVCAQRREGSDSPNDRLVRLQSLLPGQTLQMMLDRLLPAQSRMLLHDLLPGVKLPEELQHIIIKHSEGNPYFIEEFVRMFIEKGFMQQQGGEWQLSPTQDLVTIPIPNSLETLIRSRIDTLPEELKFTLQCASIIGFEFNHDLLQTITQRLDTKFAVARLISRLMLQPTNENDQSQFSHALFESVVYNSMLKTQRKALHVKVAETYELRQEASDMIYAKELAYHYMKADEPVKALPYLIQAGEQAAGQFAESEALMHFQEAAHILSDLPQRNDNWQWRIAIGLGDVYCFVGKYADSLTALRTGIPLAETGRLQRPQRVDLYRRLGHTAHKQGDLEMARTYFEIAQEMLGEPDDAPLQLEASRTLTGMAWVHFAQGQFDEALKACDKSLIYAQAADGLNELAATENLLGGIYYHLSKWRKAFHHTIRAMVLREQMGYSWGVAKTLSNLGILAFAVGHWAKSISFFERSLALRQEMGDVEGIAILQNNLGSAYRGQGKPALAEPYFRESVKTATLYNINYHIANSSLGLAHVLLQQGKIEESQETIETSLNKANEIGAQDVLAEANRIQAEIMLARSELEDALTTARYAAELAAEVGNRNYEAAAWRIAAKTALALNNLEQAISHIEKASEVIAGASDDLEAGHVAAQAYQIYRHNQQTTEAEAALQTAREIFTRLEAHVYLKALEA